MGYIYQGRYFKGKPPLHHMQNNQQSTYKQHEHWRQRKEYSREILQPFNKDGSLNQQFLEAYPQEAENYRRKYGQN